MPFPAPQAKAPARLGGARAWEVMIIGEQQRLARLRDKIVTEAPLGAYSREKHRRREAGRQDGCGSEAIPETLGGLQ